MMSISVVILTLVCSLYVAEEVYSSRIFLKREMTTLGATLGASCKKLLLLKQIEATGEILASLKVQPNIRAAYLFDADGTPVSQYLDPSDMQFVRTVVAGDFTDPQNKFWAQLAQPKLTSSWQHFGLFLPIRHDGHQVGSIYLLSDLRDVYGRLNGVVFVVLSLLGLLLFLSWWLSGKLQRPVTAPLLNLVETMGTISQNKDFSVRVQKEGRDEVGLLVDGFNRMLAQIEAHRQELVAHQQSLEQTVEIRTEELRAMVAVLEQAKCRAEAASEAKSQFLANITHELRTPLIGVLGMNELLFRTALDGQQQMLATTVQKSGEDLLALINNVLDFSKIEAGKMQLAEAEFAPYRLVDEVLGLLTAAAVEKGLSLYIQVPLSATCRVLGDKMRVRQILMNLVGNAIKFTEQGSVTVKLDCSFPNPAEAVFVIDVIDTGIGMAEDAQRQLFSAFYQADDTNTRKYGGTGLGLAIVQQLVQLLAGDISLESTAGQGSRFRVSFTLPLVAPAEIQLPETLYRQPALVYVTDATCQQLLATRLSELGIVVMTATSAADAWYQLGFAERNGAPFALVLFSADARLPDGQPLYRAVRETPGSSRLRRILLLKHLEAIELQGQEHKLYLPIGWSDLAETLCRCWHELHLVESTAAEKKVVARQDPAAIKVNMLVAGGSGASRELIKLSLSDLSVVVDVAKDFDQLQMKTERAVYTVILLDQTTFPRKILLDFCRRRHENTRLVVLSSPSDAVDFLQPFVAATIEKPFKREALLPIIQQLLDNRSRVLSGVVADDGGQV